MKRAPRAATDRLPADPVIQAYKEGIDRTLIRENLRRSLDERVNNLQALLELAEEARRARSKNR
jgi:hypothetical protein